MNAFAVAHDELDGLSTLLFCVYPYADAYLCGCCLTRACAWRLFSRKASLLCVPFAEVAIDVALFKLYRSEGRHS